jgi:monovalent cation:proton antiporter-2 (CPA2) family protein
MSFLYAPIILLAAAVIVAPMVKRLGFGNVLGYLAAGLIIGPAGLRLVSDVESIAQVSELGVVMLLFLIGLELRPARLWVMRRSVLGLGAAQMIVTTGVLALIAQRMGLGWPAAVVLGFGFALSSTALVLPMLAERDLLSGQAGRDAFSVLLFQDLAIIPFVALVPLLDGDVPSLSGGEAWLALARAGGALLIVLIGGRFLIRPIFRAIGGAKTPEIFTATTLLIVIGTAALVSAAGLSMSLGAFMAGVILSDSEYRHELQADIKPFEGLLLGVFFISVGMSANLGLLLDEPFVILGAVAALLVLKIAIGLVLARVAGHDIRNAVRFALALPQAGEFAFVLFAVALGEGILNQPQSEGAMLVVTLSMMLSPLLFLAAERWLLPRLGQPKPRKFDTIDAASAPVIICGFGRVGQIIGRVLLMRGIAFTALDANADQIDQVRRFGTKAYYGDPTRPDMLRSAGAETAKVLVVALDDVADMLKIVHAAQRHFPHLVIMARARNRRAAHLLMDLGVTRIVRETFYSSLRMTEDVLEALGLDAAEIERTITTFRDHDEKVLRDQHGFYKDERQMIQTTKQAAEELRGLLEADTSER